VLLRLLYAAGLRVDEIAHLAWRDLRERGDAGQVTAYGKGGKTRVVLLPAAVWRELVSIRDSAPPDAPIFASRARGGFLTPTQVRRLIYAAAAAAFLDERPRRTGFATPTPPMPLSAAHPSTWSRPRSATSRCPPPGAICTRGQPTVRRATYPSERGRQR